MATIQELELSRQLVLLYHASICPFATDQIPQSYRSFTNCAETRALLQHSDNCDEDDCPVPNCEQSRFLLSHFQICWIIYVWFANLYGKISKEMMVSYLILFDSNSIIQLSIF